MLACFFGTAEGSCAAALGSALSALEVIMPLSLNEAWESTVANDSPYYRAALSSREREALSLAKTASP